MVGSVEYWGAAAGTIACPTGGEASITCSSLSWLSSSCESTGMMYSRPVQSAEVAQVPSLRADTGCVRDMNTNQRHSTRSLWAPLALVAMRSLGVLMMFSGLLLAVFSFLAQAYEVALAFIFLFGLGAFTLLAWQERRDQISGKR